MKSCLLMLLIAYSLDAQGESRPQPTVESLQAENAALKAQIDEMRLEANYQQRVCQQPDLMQLRLATIRAQQAAQKAQQQKSPEPEKK